MKKVVKTNEGKVLAVTERKDITDKKVTKEPKAKVSRAKLFEYVGPQELTQAQKRGQYGMLLRAIMGTKNPVTKHEWADLFVKAGGKTVQDAERIVNWYLKRAVSEKLVAEANV